MSLFECNPSKAESIISRIFIVSLERKKSLSRWMEKFWKGEFPSNKLKLVLAWMVIHQEELEANWRLLSAGEGYYKIEPLK